MNAIYRSATTALLVLVSACGSSTEPGGGNQAPVLETLPRPLTAAEQQLVSSANDFSLSLFRRLSATGKDSNVFASPLSASMALGMAMNGASGTTLSQMKGALAFGTASDADINASYKSLIAMLRGLDPTTDMRVANSVWYRNDFPFNQSFLDVVKPAFDAQVTPLDFRQASAVTSINDWVSNATAGKIPKILDRIESDQVMFLINAIYFKGSWRDKFDPAETKDAPFHGVAGDQNMKLMHRSGTMKFLFRSDVNAVDLPYGNGAFSMTILLNNTPTTLDQLAASLTPAVWSDMMSQFHDLKSDVYLPKLRMEWDRELNDDLKSLGMTDAFSPGIANFMRMSPKGDALYIDKVKQKTYVDINEEGTEAAAVTSVGIGVTSLPPQVRADRPFLVVIRERLTGTIIFMGKVVRMP